MIEEIEEHLVGLGFNAINSNRQNLFQKPTTFKGHPNFSVGISQTDHNAFFVIFNTGRSMHSFDLLGSQDWRKVLDEAFKTCLEDYKLYMKEEKVREVEVNRIKELQRRLAPYIEAKGWETGVLPLSWRNKNFKDTLLLEMTKEEGKNELKVFICAMDDYYGLYSYVSSYTYEIDSNLEESIQKLLEVWIKDYYNWQKRKIVNDLERLIRD